MGSIIEIARKSQEYVDKLQTNIQRVIYTVEPQILDLNRKQMLVSKGNDDRPLINNRTGNENLSKAYARKMNKTKPNIFVDGSYQKEMYLDVNRPNEYFIGSRNRLVKYIPQQYTNVHGIAPSNQPKAQEITGNAIAKDYINSIIK